MMNPAINDAMNAMIMFTGPPVKYPKIPPTIASSDAAHPTWVTVIVFLTD